MSAYDYQYDYIDCASEERDREERIAEDAHAFSMLSEDEQEERIQAERLAFLAAEAHRITRRAPVTMNVALIGNGLFVRVGRKVA